MHVHNYDNSTELECALYFVRITNVNNNVNNTFLHNSEACLNVIFHLFNNVEALLPVGEELTQFEGFPARVCVGILTHCNDLSQI